MSSNYRSSVNSNVVLDNLDSPNPVETKESKFEFDQIQNQFSVNNIRENDLKRTTMLIRNIPSRENTDTQETFRNTLQPRVNHGPRIDTNLHSNKASSYNKQISTVSNTPKSNYNGEMNEFDFSRFEAKCQR